ncbi:MAG TPA: anthranilate phosphoribosyltransferase [Rudaea sp.]|nr:anthranilate phosphoribosyltransferase [Rudaea sp.]
MPITPQQALQRVIVHREIFHDEMIDLMRQIMRGEVSAPMVAAILTGLRVKKETVGEITAAATVMREMVARVPYSVADAASTVSAASSATDAGTDPHLVDIVGTGGDSAGTFNISTASMFVAAAAGARVAKHGNRSVSSNSGSADVLEAFGAAIDLAPDRVARCLGEVGIGFMFAPNHHPAMKVVAPVRKEMGVRTLFNILGPLTNPAGASNILMGVFHPDLVGIQVRVLQRLGTGNALVVWGREGLDEISLAGPTLIGELRDGRVSEYEVEPEQFGLARAGSAALRVDNPEQSKMLVLEALSNAAGPARDIVALNAGAALYAAGIAASIADGVARAKVVLESGAARAKLDQFIVATQRLRQS